MNTISAAAVPRNDLIGRVRRRLSDFESIGTSTDPVGQRVRNAGGDTLEHRLGNYTQPTLPEIRKAASLEASASRRTAWEWAAGAGVGVGLAVGVSIVAPALIPVVAVMGVAGVGLAAVRTTAHASRCEIASDVVHALDEWQIAYEAVGAKGNVPAIEHVGYRSQLQ